jgi:hypothetical protein
MKENEQQTGQPQWGSIKEKQITRTNSDIGIYQWK